MNSEPDLRHSISLRPHPFPTQATQAARSDRTESPRPHHHASEFIALTPVNHPGTPDPAHHNKNGTSTAFEPVTPPADAAGQDPLSHRNLARFNAADTSDVERQSPPSYDRANDPFNLADKIKPKQELEDIRANTSRKRDGCGPLVTNKKALRARKVEAFYENQNENIERLLKPVSEHVREAKEEEGGDNLQFKIAVWGSFAANIVLVGLQLYGAISSGSLSLFTTMADAIFDPMSNITLILANRAVKRVNPHRFPSGKARIETAGNIFFCFLMTSVSLIIIVMACRELAEGHGEDLKKLHVPSVIAVASAFGTKFCLFLYCWALRNKYSQVRILWEDHRNDLFINGFGILTSVGGAKLKWFIDPVGAIVISCLITFLWMRTAYSEFQLLIGVSADTSMLQLITYISMTHSPAITGIDTVRAWHSGPRLIVEVDIVMDSEDTLRNTHDVAEALQTKLESLPDVERCYVHVDYETSHAPEHFTKKEL
ncbi:Cation efflux protein [Neofusicoccum parvum]|uniref:Putative cation diffusion facilitator 1 protein n=1 Tax=Botryosphaeria parva (strain UCR-NP2) TaxID=1287680 RepID=R1GDC3_BOTPV|nr:putative cation diffusion facilitator 1 protein [Neofusicoccum parvum UCRNP2]GME58849.1 Cation efflux protein [Neofusicoccum parvum]